MYFRPILAVFFIGLFFIGNLKPLGARPATPAAVAGSLDTSFNGTGISSTAFDHPSSAASGVAIQSDGKIVTAGLTTGDQNQDVALARFNPNGDLDTSFNGTGKVTTHIGNVFSDAASIAIQTDGKIVITGTASDTTSGSNEILVIRYNPDGNLDTTFAATGIVRTPIGAGGDHGNAVVIQPDGKIVVVGNSVANQNSDFAIVRYDSDGGLDAAFNGTGIELTAIGKGDDAAGAVELQVDGKIVVAGTTVTGSKQNFAVARYDADGGLDSSFNGTGKVTTSFGNFDDFAGFLAIQPDGKIIVAGTSSFDKGPAFEFAVVRYNANGSLDGTFNGTGKLTTRVSTESASGGAVALQSDGKIIVGGSGYVGDILEFAIVRYNSNGSLDTSFNETGIVLTPIGNFADLYALALQPDGKIVTAGVESTGKFTNDFVVARYLDYTSHVSFDYDGDGRSDISVFRPATRAWYLLQSQGGFLGVGFGDSDDKIAPADYDGDGKTDIAVYRPSTGVWYVINSATNTFSYYSFGIAEDLPAPADYDGDGKADICVFRPSTGSWYRLNSSTGGFVAVPFGADGDRPAIGDFDGDGKADISVYRPSNGGWYQLNSSDGTFSGTQFGTSTDVITPADFDGDGKTDLAVFRPSNGVWYRLNSSDGAFVAFPFGANGDIPAAGDFDGDGKADVTVFRPSESNWYRLNSSNGAFVALQFGASGDQPTPSAFH